MIRVAVEDFLRNAMALLEKVSRGEEICIEQDGRVMARITPEAPSRAEAVSTPAEAPPAAEESSLSREFERLREGITLGGLDWKALRDEGRR